MKKIKRKRFFAFTLAILLLFLPFSSIKTVQVVANAIKPIEMYLIGGQSNAVGYSPVQSNETETFENVWYAGEIERHLLTKNGYGTLNYKGPIYSWLTFEQFKKSVTGGYGLVEKIGPEYGMAEVFNSHASINAPVMIFKTAAGGTCLRDSTTDLSNIYGNWYPRSFWEEGYVPNIIESSTDNDATGILYNLFITNFSKVYGELVDNGYQPTVKGMAWMQGESDLGRVSADEYTNLLQTFITDIRRDLVQITGDEKLFVMPFVIGEIPTSFKKYNAPNVPPMIEMQRQVAKNMGNSVATISTDDLIIVNPDGSYNGPDMYHFSFKDAVTIGERFANKLLEISDTTRVFHSAINGEVLCSLSDMQVTMTLIPDEHYKLDRLSLNGEDITGQVKELIYTALLKEKENIFAAEFIKKTCYRVEYEENNRVCFINKPMTGYEGECFSLEISSEDYVIEKVMYSDEKMIYNHKTKRYEIIPTKDGMVKVYTTKKTGGVMSLEQEQKKGTGCGSSMMFVCVPALLCSFGLVFFKNRL